MSFVLISPAKTMRFDRPRPHLVGGAPHFSTEALQIIQVLKKLPPLSLEKMMALSPKLAQLNADRFQAFAKPPHPDATDAAILAYQGDTYIGFDAKTLNDKHLQAAHTRIGILTGLYGLLQPLDAIQPYRLEMGTALAVGTHKNLYGFWGDRITERINALVAEHDHKMVIGCASREYCAAIDPKKLRVPFIDCVFKETKNNQAKVIGLLAKRARGMMARFVVMENITTPAALKKFSACGYAFDPAASTDHKFVFVR